MAAHETALLERAHDGVRARVAEVGAPGDLGERPRRRRVVGEQVEQRRGAHHAVRLPCRHRRITSPSAPLTSGASARVTYHDHPCCNPICDDIGTGGTSVKLDLLYEIDAPRPWEAGPHPYGQRAREQRAYAEMHRPGEARRQARLQRGVVRRAPLPRGSLALPRARGRDRRAHPGDREHPARVRRDAVAVWLHPPDARRREGRHRRHPLAGTRRVGHGPLDADGADRVPRRPRSQPRRSGPRRSRSSARCGARSTSSGTAPPSSSRVASSRRSRTRTRTRRAWMAATSEGSSAVAGSNQLGLAVVLDHAAARQDGRADHAPTATRGTARTRSRSPTSPPTRSRPTPSSTAPRPSEQAERQRHLGVGRVVVPEHRRVHARLGAAPPDPAEASRRRSRC